MILLCYNSIILWSYSIIILWSPYIYFYDYIRHRAARHQGNVSNETTNCQLPVADYQLPVADYQLLLRHPLGASPGEIADCLNSFKGPHGARDGISWNQSYGLHKNIRLLFRLFFHTPFFHLFVPKRCPKGSHEVWKNRQNLQKNIHPIQLGKHTCKKLPKVWKSYPLQRFKPISKGPRYPKQHHNLDPKWIPELQIVRKMGTQKNS